MNFKTLVIAGLGSIGGSMFAVGKEYLPWFAKVVAVDRETKSPLLHDEAAVEVLVGDVTDTSFLERLVRGVPEPVLLLNLCAGTDHVRLRKMIEKLPVAYLDSGCCTPEGTDEHRFSRMMPYTLTPVESGYPHWLCWGINPGVVELVTRMLLRRMGHPASEAEVTIFEHDSLQTANPDHGIAVGWCPAFLVEEMLISPSLVVEEGVLREGLAAGGQPVLVCWGNEKVPCRLVGHEDIWNLGQLHGVCSARFAYGLTPRVMAVLEGGDAPAAAAELKVVSPATPVLGIERIAVQVRSSSSGETRTLLWETNHERVWKRLGVNGVQFQTGVSLWFALHMLQNTRLRNASGHLVRVESPAFRGGLEGSGIRHERPGHGLGRGGSLVHSSPPDALPWWARILKPLSGACCFPPSGEGRIPRRFQVLTDAYV